MRFKKLFILSAFTLVCGTLVLGASGYAKDTSAERQQTLYVNGMQWGAPANFNMLTGNPAWPCNTGRELIYETLFMFNQLTGKNEPLLGKSFKWTDAYTLEITMNPAAKFNDGKKLTAADAEYSYKLGKKYDTNWSTYWPFLTDVVAKDADTLLIKLSKTNYNKLFALDSIQAIPILPKHIWSKIEDDSDGKIAKIREFFNAKPVGSGPYMVKSYDDTKITIERDEDYWGKALFGKLPAPKYITHVIFKSNDEGNLALRNGDIDMSQQFTPQIWNMFDEGVKTYLKKPPYYVPGSMPSIFFNMTVKGLDNAKVRRAIAMSIDYKSIGDKAMSGYTAPIVPSIALNTEAEAKYIDDKAVDSLLWSYDVAGANKLLDSIGAKKGSDGIRVLNGTRLGPWDVECPYGWSDWNASLEIVAQCAKAIGIELRTKFPEQPVWNNDMQTGKFDIIMNTPAGAQSPSLPWQRARTIMYSNDVPKVGELAFWNWGRYKSTKADQLIEDIPTKSDFDELKAMYTELDKIYLTDIPSIPLMYRPWLFYSVSEQVWKGFPVQGDGTDIPPQCCMDGAGIRALYQLHH